MAYDAARIRREEDMRRLRELIRKSDGRIRLVGATGDPVDRLRLVLNYQTVPSSRFPQETASSTDVDIVLPIRYPFVAPKVTIKTPIFHPNVYSSGLVCLGETWIAAEGLDLFVRRLIRLITFDPLVSGGLPPANQMASSWYHMTRRTRPDLFPTEAVSFGEEKGTSRIGFNDKSVTDQARSGNDSRTRRIVRCEGCRRGLRVPAGRSGTIRCPHCEHRFGVNA